MKLVISDLSNIEGRILAYLAGEEWKLQAFRDYDAGNGADLYNITAAGIIGGSPFDVSKKNRNIFGKVPDLACFHPDTQVLTHAGYKRIKEVLLTDKLWDGIRWVTHDGVIDKGVQRVVDVDGINVTPEHSILTGQIWKQAQLLATNASTLSRALATGSSNLPSSVLNMGPPAASSPSSHNAPVAPNRTKLSWLISCLVRAPDAMRAPSRNRLTHGKCTTDMNLSFRTYTTVAAFSTGSVPASIGAETLTTRPIKTTVGGGSPYTNRGSQIVKNISDTLSRYLGGISQPSNWTAQMLMGIMNRAISVLLPVKKTGITSAQSVNYNCKSKILSPVYDIANAGPLNRFTVKTNSGHLIVHNCGYEGGAGAFQQFAKAYGILMEDQWPTIQQNIDPEYVYKACENLESWGRMKQVEMGVSETEWIASETVKLAWRGRHPATRQLWYAVKDAAVNAIRSPGVAFKAGAHMMFQRVKHTSGEWLLCRLPSGKFLTYYDPQLTADGGISYMGMGTENGQQGARVWCALYTYGGKLVENATQAVAGDALKATMPAIEAAGYEIVLTVHDEDVTQTPDTDAFSADALSELLATPPAWAPTLPLSAAGFEAYRYKKED